MIHEIPPLKSIYIDGRRNIKSLEIEFNNKTNVFVGPNGVGKTTILQLMNKIFTRDDYEDVITIPEKNLGIVLTFQEIILDKKWIEKLDLSLSLMHLKDKSIKSVQNILDVTDYLYTNRYSSQRSLIDLVPFELKKLEGRKCQIALALLKVDNKTRDPSNILPGYLLCDSLVFLSDSLNWKNILSYYKDRVLDFNISDKNIHDWDSFLTKYVQNIEQKQEMHSTFTQFTNKASKTFNKLTKARDQQFRYIGKPETKIEITNAEGRDINNLSSGERQLERLKLFRKAINALKPHIVFIDEPELHLNYSQQIYFTELIQDLIKNKCQVFLATHSSYFIRTTDYQVLKFLKIRSDSNPTYIKLPPESRNFLQYPDLFFANNLIIFEAYADSIFFERTLNIILKEMGYQDLASANIIALPSYGKSGIERLAQFAKKRLLIDYYVVADFDLILNPRDYSYIKGKSFDKIYAQVKKNLISQPLERVSKFQDLPLDKKQVKAFLASIDNVVTSEKVASEDKKVLEQLLNLVDKSIYSEQDLKSGKYEDVRDLFKQNNSWLLKQRKIENYVVDELKIKGKLAADKLNELYYPTSMTEIKSHLKDERYIDELKALTKEIIKSFDIREVSYEKPKIPVWRRLLQ